MAINPTAPGVYVEEIATLPPSVAPVATAIPAFIGYTEKALINGQLWPFSGTDKSAPPVRITSMLEYEQYFGGPKHEDFSVNVAPSTPVASITSQTQFVLYYHMQMYFANGGGPCYVIAADKYGTSTTIDDTAILNGLERARAVDEVTLLVAPEAASLSTVSEFKAINDAMLDQCSDLQDRFAIIDVLNNASTVFADAAAFRSNQVGANNLKYGAAYYPPLKTILSLYYQDDEVAVSGAAVGITTLSQLLNGVFASNTVQVTADNTGWTAPATEGLKLTVGALTPNTITYNDTGLTGSKTEEQIAAAFAAEINDNTFWNLYVVATVSGDTITLTAKATGSAGNFTVAKAVVSTPVTIGTAVTGVNPDATKYNAAKAVLDANYKLTLMPSSSMAGVYAAVDATRGVWKAPANVSLAYVDSLAENVNQEDNGTLNVDATSGKSINAIRTFAGRGVLVWGARTLAGNDNEWRYVNVRRLFNFVEESLKKATEGLVFEPNDANTWANVKSLSSNFLTNIWRDGALAGAKPEHAFFVKVGLNETMTAQDILEGKLIVLVGMAAVRPAEFIMLKFMHKLQES